MMEHVDSPLVLGLAYFPASPFSDKPYMMGEKSVSRNKVDDIWMVNAILMDQ